MTGSLRTYESLPGRQQMAQNKPGLHKKVSSIFDGAPVPKADCKQQPSIAPLPTYNGDAKPSQKEAGININLIRFSNNGEQKIITLPSTVTVIGRRHNCDLRIPLDCISKKHCQISCDEGVLKIRDLGSRNGTFLNGARINEAVIQPGDRVRVGPIGFVFQINGQPEKIVPPARQKPAPPKKEEKVSEKAAEKPANGQFASFAEIESSELSAKESTASASGSGLLIDDSDSLKDDSNLLVDDLN
jgi:pSer/pThr/pTyr-binding forkhead associated (FHA) protein